MPIGRNDHEFGDELRGELAALSDEAQLVAREIEQSFDKIGTAIGQHLGDALAKGKLDFRDFKNVLLKDLGETVAELTKMSLKNFIVDPLLGRLQQSLGLAQQNLTAPIPRKEERDGGLFGRSRQGHKNCCYCGTPFGLAASGSGLAGGLFGRAAAPIAVNVTLGAGVNAGLIASSESQIATSLARAVRSGLKGL